MNSTWTSRAALAAAGIILGVGLAGCTDSRADPPETPSPATSAPSSTPTTVQPTEPVINEPKMPDEAAQPGRPGAVAHAKYFLDLLNYAKATGIVQPLRRTFSSCTGCDHYADEYQRLYESGGSYEGSRWRPTTTTAYPAPGGGYFVFLNVAAQRGMYIEDSEAEAIVYKPAHYELRLQLLRQAGKWQIVEMMDASS